MTQQQREAVSLEEAVGSFREIFKSMAAGAGDRDLTRTHPFEHVRALADAGFGRLRIPAEFGGFGISLPELFELLAEAGRADSNIPQILRGHFTTVEILRHETDPVRREHWLRKIADGVTFGNAQSEPARPGGGFDTTTRIETIDGQRAVTGTKYYSTGSLFADYIRVAALDETGSAVFAIVSASHPGVTHEDDWDGFGQRLTGSGTTRFDRAPVEELGYLGRSRGELKSVPSFVQIVHLANLAGIARSILDDAIALVRSRQRTNFHALAEEPTADPEVLAVVGHISRHCLTVDSLLRTVAKGLEEAEERWAAGDENAFARNYVDVSAAQFTIIESVLDAANLLFNAGGASAVREVQHLDRHWRNARTLASHNPVIYKPRIIGEYVMHGKLPGSAFDRQRSR